MAQTFVAAFLAIGIGWLGCGALLAAAPADAHAHMAQSNAVNMRA